MKSVKAKKEKPYMSDDAFAELELSLKQAVAYEKGEREGFRVNKKPVPPSPKPRSKANITRLRRRFGYSQTMFARLLNVSPKTVQSWEQGLRQPSDAALKLSAVAEKHPNALFDSE